jgi:hypothetical protein
MKSEAAVPSSVPSIGLAKRALRPPAPPSSSGSPTAARGMVGTGTSDGTHLD